VATYKMVLLWGSLGGFLASALLFGWSVAQGNYFYAAICVVLTGTNALNFYTATLMSE
jgi:hypothetical protein